MDPYEVVSIRQVNRFKDFETVSVELPTSPNFLHM